MWLRALAAKGGEKEIKQKCPLNMRHAINAINEIVRFLAQSEMIDQKKKQRFSLSPLDVASFNYSSWLVFLFSAAFRLDEIPWVGFLVCIHLNLFIHFALKSEIRKIIENNFSRFVYGRLRVRSGEIVLTQIVFPSIGARKNRFSILYNSFIHRLLLLAFYLNHLIINVQPYKIYVIAPILLSVYCLIQRPKQLPRRCFALTPIPDPWLPLLHLR